MSLHTVVIGGGGHVGSYLVPRLVEEGHRVTTITRGVAEPYGASPLWRDVEHLRLDREAAERDSSFGEVLLGLAPDIVVDLICYRLESDSELDYLKRHKPNFAGVTKEIKNLKTGEGKAFIWARVSTEDLLESPKLITVRPKVTADRGKTATAF